MIQTQEAKAKPDFLDMDKDGDKKEPMKKAVKDKEEKKNEELTDKQKKLPAGLQKAIAKKQGGDKVEEKFVEIKQLLEQEVEKAEIVIAAKSIVDELQNMIEDLGKLQNAALENENIFTQMMEVAKTCSLGQMTDSLFKVGGQYRRNM